MRQRHLFRQQQRGTTALEFALLAPALFLMLFGTVESGLMYYTQHTLESATFNASRTGKTGFVESNATREQTILATIDRLVGRLIDMEQVRLTSTSYNGFGNINQPEPFVDANGNGARDDGENFTDINGNGLYDLDQGEAGQGAERDIVVYTINYPWRVTTPILANIIGDEEGEVALSARIVVRNEPYETF